MPEPMKITATHHTIKRLRIKIAGCRNNCSVISLLLISITLLISRPALAKTDIAKLRNNLQLAIGDTGKLRAYEEIFNYYQYLDPDSAAAYIKQGLALFTTRNYKVGKAEMLADLAGMYTAQSMPEIARQTAEASLAIYTELNHRSGIASANNILGIIEGRKSNYYEAVGHFFIALKIFEELKDTIGITDDYIKLGAANENINNHDKALEYYNKGLAYIVGKPVDDVTIFLNNNIGASYLGKNDIPNAIKYLQRSLDESTDTTFSQIRILPLINMGEVYTQTGDTAKALAYLKEGLAIAEKENLPEDKANLLMNIAKLMKSDREKALALQNEAFETAKAIGAKKLQVDILTNIISIYKQKGDYKQAYLRLDEQKILSDSIFSNDNSRNIANLEALYNLDKLNVKVQQLELVEQKQQERGRITIVITVFITILLVVIFIFFWKTKLLNHELNRREYKLKKASAVKNKLISIIAHDLIGNIGFMPVALRLCKDSNIPAGEKIELLNELELNATASYETMQNMLDWGKAQIQGIILNQSHLQVNEIVGEVLVLVNIAASHKHVNIQNNIQPGTIVYADPDHFRFIIRNLLSNAVKFSPQQGHVEIGNSKNDGLVTFFIKDNGPGVPADRTKDIFESYSPNSNNNGHEKGNGIGLKLCKEFVIENGGKIWVTSHPGNGATFYFSLKTNG